MSRSEEGRKRQNRISSRKAKLRTKVGTKNSPTDKASVKVERYRLNRLKRGLPILDSRYLHKAMASWKAELGDPRPENMVLSRMCPFDCANRYIGHNQHGRPYTLCTMRFHYVWATSSQARARDRIESYLSI